MEESKSRDYCSDQGTKLRLLDQSSVVAMELVYKLEVVYKLEMHLEGRIKTVELDVREGKKDKPRMTRGFRWVSSIITKAGRLVGQAGLVQRKHLAVLTVILPSSNIV